MDKPKYQMSINLNVLNHLGLNLYSNVPAVLSEVVANSWDADASEVDIEIEPGKITITDNGQGMTLEELNEKYLNVGYERRKHDAVRTPQYDRPVMGRKGIGKLSLFSIADTVEVQTVKGESKHGFAMSARKIAAQIGVQDSSTYHPDPLSDDQITLDTDGTRIVLTELKKRGSQTPTALRKRLARRFSIIGTEHNFTVSVNGVAIQITDRDCFHKLQYLWYYGDESEKYVALCNSGKLEYDEKRESKISVKSEENAEPVSYPVTGWIVTTVGSGDLRAGDDNLNKIVIMVRGKLAQEDILEDFPEGGLYTKYLIGEIHADFLDRDDQEDIATSNRQEIIKDDPRYLALRNWVKDELRNISNQWTDLRNKKGIKDATQIPGIDEWVKGLDPDRQKQAKSMFGKIGQLTLEEDERTELYQHSALAFESLKYKSLDKLDQVPPENLQLFARMFANLDDIEASLYYKIVQKRLRIIKALHEQVETNVKEKVIQNHLYDHLWLLDPSWDMATESPLMEQNVQKEFAKLDAQLTEEERKGRFDIKYKMTSGKHVIIELKRANRILSQYHLLEQVEKYGESLRKLVRATGKNEPVEIVCIVGKPLAQWVDAEATERSRKTMETQNVRVVLYDELIEDAYRSYQAFLDQNREAGRVYQLIKDIEIESQ